VAGGLLAGGAAWVIEAYARFGGVAGRLRAAGAEQGGFGLHFALPGELRALNGPTLCRPCTIGLRDPALDLWWFLLPALVTVGVLAARRVAPPRPQGPGQPDAGAPGMSPPGIALLPAVCGLCLAAQYLFMINYAAPRFLLPAYALLAIPAADGLAFLITRTGADLRPAMTAVVTCLLVVQLVAQHLVLDHEAGGTMAFHDDYARIAAELAARGVRPPCLIQGVQYIPIAYDAGCASAGAAAQDVAAAVIVRSGRRPPPYARNWHAYQITGTKILKVNAYIR
jgi:hypothetical protein